tara:strand:- start:29 stop:913 length:885 start_codon:yes stop_codon:yes gene_type:complete
MPIFNRRQAGFIVFEDGGTDGSGTDAGDKIIFDGGNNGDTAEHFLKYQDDVSDEAKPKFLTEAADGSGDYSKENVFATDSGWVMRPGSPATGNDNPDAQPEVLVCSRGLKSFGLGGPTARQITIGNASSKTTLFPDGDTFTGVASSSENDIVVYTYFNESVGVIGTPQIELKDGTNLDSSFGGYGSTMLDYKSSLSNLDAGIVAFGIAAGVDTRTSAVDNNTLGVNSDDSISLNSGRITKNAGGVLRDESDNVLVFNDGASTEAPMSFGEIVLEDGDTAEVLLRAASDASFTVS